MLSDLLIQVEAATGGQDVVRFCGGLRAILGAAGLPLGNALPCPAENAASTQSLQPEAETQAAAVSAPGSEAGAGVFGPIHDASLGSEHVLGELQRAHQVVHTHSDTQKDQVSSQ